MSRVTHSLSTLLLMAVVASCGVDRDDLMGVGEETCGRQYAMIQLEAWYARTGPVMAMPGITMRDLDETKGCIMFGISDREFRQAIVLKLDELRIPRDAVYIRIVVGGTRN